MTGQTAAARVAKAWPLRRSRSPAADGAATPPRRPGPGDGNGPRENVFCWLPQVEHHTTWPGFTTTLSPRTTAAAAPLACGCGDGACPACADDGWACWRCGLAFFGAPPGHGLCPGCLTTGAAA